MSGPRHFTMGAENMASVDCFPVLDVQNGRQDQGATGKESGGCFVS